MSLQLLAEGPGTTFSKVPAYERAIAEGGWGELHVRVRLIPVGWARHTTTLVTDLSSKLSAVSVRTRDDVLFIRFRKGVPVLGIVVAAVLAIGVIAVLIASWQLYRVVEAVPVVGKFMAPLLVLGVGAWLLATIMPRLTLPLGRRRG